MTVEQINALWRLEVGIRDKTLWRLLYETAARANEVLALDVTDLEVGFELAVAAAEQAAVAGDPRTQGRSLILVGMVQMFVDPAGAASVLAEAVELAVSVDDDSGQVEALQILAYTHLFRTDHQSTLYYADQSLPALDRLGHDQLRAWDAALRADVAAQTGRFEEACVHARVGLDIAVGIGEPVSADGAFLPLVRALVRSGSHR